MTSSLVGSEMCIRDRSSSVPWAFMDTKNDPTGDQCLSCAEGWGAYLPYCLLYTSDAADDM
eukprot:4780845-Prorocentrum_lima.AAC.1